MIESPAPLVEIAPLSRHEYIGSSDVAGIIGVSKWATPLDVYRGKVHPESIEITDAKRKIFRRGHLLEPVIRTMAVEDYALNVFGVNRRYVHPARTWMRAEIDFETLDPDGSLVNNDCKSVSPHVADQWGEAETDEIPIEYHAQFQWGMFITGARRCDVWALFGADDLVRYVVHRDEAAIEGIHAKVDAFWHEHVLPKRPPSPVTIDDVEFLMRRLRGRRVVANPDVLSTIAEYVRCKENVKSIGERIDDLKFQIVDAMRQGAEEQFGNPLGDDEGAALVHPETGFELMTWRQQSSSRLDVDAVRKKAPEIAAECTKDSTTRVLRVSKPKKGAKR